VERTQIVEPTALWVTRDVGYQRLVLSACNPLYSAAQRIIVFARLERVVARGAALGPRP
jgi:sortase A